MHKIKSALVTALFFFLCFSNLVAENVSRERVRTGAILHCWCWSFKTIEENLPKIAEAGFTALQTSPINTCLVGENGGLELMGPIGSGKWWYHYQPTDWKIGNYQLGSREEFASMCAKADEYGLAVIVDVLPNHTTPKKDAISKEFIEACGGMEKLYHASGERDISNYGDRFLVVNGKMGGLPDVNTENPLFQAYFMNYMNDVIACGADGFRFDTAKHIALPDDPLDAASSQNDFWEIFTGRKAINGTYLSNAENLFLYGEVLQGGASREDAYGNYLSVTASSYGGMLRSSVKNNKLLAKGLSDWRNAAGGEKLVTWIESHDTYANQGESAALTNFQLRAGYAVIAARKDGTPLFFNRPKGEEGVQFPGKSKIGDSGNDEYFNPEVVALNKFRLAMAGEDEELLNGSSTSVLIIKRGGGKGIVAINMREKGLEKIEVPVSLPDGKYVDKANKLKFTVKNGVLKGGLPRKHIAVIY